MKKLGWALAAVIIGIGAWFDWTYHAVRMEIADLQSSLPSEHALDQLPPEQTAEKLKLAAADCGRVDALEGSAVARLLKSAQIKQLSQQCDLVRARQSSLEGP
jgi:hypothetical protein